MVEIITRDVTSSDLKEVVNKLLPDSIAKDIEKACQGIYPLHDVYIRKVRSHAHVTDIILYVVSTVKPPM
jgi:small subunit ribosomal protein S3Ae